MSKLVPILALGAIGGLVIGFGLFSLTRFGAYGLGWWVSNRTGEVLIWVLIGIVAAGAAVRLRP